MVNLYDLHMNYEKCFKSIDEINVNSFFNAE